MGDLYASGMTSALDRFYGVIPAGGIGSRLWPLSRQNAPKFLHDLTGSGETLLRATWQRLVPLVGDKRIMVVTGVSHDAAVREQLPELDDENIVLESGGRDSTAAIGLAAAILVRREPDVIIGSFHADHVIKDLARFRSAVKEAVQVADHGFIATVGIEPSEPATGFGYIRMGDELELPRVRTARRVVSFTEKPSLATAKKYLASDDYVWNAGMFIARADRLLEEIGKSEPELLDGITEIAEAWETPDRDRVTRRVWPTLKKIAIDYSVAEPAAAAGHLAVIPGYFRWTDVGDFASIAKLHSDGRPNNLAILGEGARVLSDSSSGVVVSSTGRVISLVGLKNIVVVDTPDALLVTTTDKAQQVKQTVDTLKGSGHESVL